jgi:RHS repeat-associated protein
VMVARQDSTGDFEQFAWDGDQMIGSYDTLGSARWEAVFGAGQDELLAFYDYQNGNDLLPVRDWRNNIVSAFDTSSETMMGSASYTAEGRVTTYDNTGSTLCFEEGSGSVCPMPGGLPFAFNGQWRSSLTGLSYMRNRWYSPRLGQFMSHDPLHYVDSVNLYSFAGFDPINSWDPMGLSDVSLVTESRVSSDPVTPDRPKPDPSKPDKGPSIPERIFSPSTYTPSTDEYNVAVRNRDPSMLYKVGPMMAEQTIVIVRNMPHHFLFGIRDVVIGGTAFGMRDFDGADTAALSGLSHGIDLTMGALALDGMGSLIKPKPKPHQFKAQPKWSVSKNVTKRIPSDWKASPNSKGIGTKWHDPKNQGNGVRIDKGNPNSGWPSQRVDHVVIRREGKVVGRDGRPIQGTIKDNAENAHIPLSEYEGWTQWDSP